MPHLNRKFAFHFALVPLLAAAACGQSPTAQSGGSSGAGGTTAEAAYAKYAGMSASQRDAALVKAAKKEGQLVIYTSNTDIAKLTEPFQKKYGIKVKYYRANSETVLQRILQEASGNRVANDVVDTNQAELNILGNKGLLSPYTSQYRDTLTPAAKTSKYWTATRFNAFVLAWNTQQVKPPQVPKSILDLAQPQWKGRIALEAGDYDWYGAMSTYLQQKKGMSAAAVNSFFSKLAANAKIVKGHTVMGELLGAGQFAATPDLYSHTVDKAAQKGAPETWRNPPIDPVILRPNGQALMKNAKHPAAALLYTDFVLTEGQKDIAKKFRIPAQPKVAGVTNPLPAGVETYPIPDSVADNSAKWSKAYDELIRGLPQASGQG